MDLNYWKLLWRKEYNLKLGEFAEAINSSRNYGCLTHYQEHQFKIIHNKDFQRVYNALKDKCRSIVINYKGFTYTINKGNKTQTELHNEYEQVNNLVRQKYLNGLISEEDYEVIQKELFFTFATFIRDSRCEKASVDKTCSITELSKESKKLEEEIASMESVLNSAIKARGEFNDNLNRFVKTNKSDILGDYRTGLIYDKKISDIESYLKIRRNYLDKNRMIISYSYYGIPASIWTFKSKQMDILSELLVLECNNESISLDLKICDTDIQLGSMNGFDTSRYDCIRDGYVNSISRNNESIKSLKSEFVRNSLYNRFSNGFITRGELVLKEDDNSKCSDIDMVFKVVC